MPLIHEILIATLIVIGAVFALIGSYGMIRLPDLMSRLHAPTKATTLGVGGALVASMVYFLALEGTLSIHELLITLFLFITAPITASYLSKAYMHTQLKEEEIPPPAPDKQWATYGDHPGDDEDQHRAS